MSHLFQEHSWTITESVQEVCVQSRSLSHLHFGLSQTSETSEVTVDRPLAPRYHFVIALDAAAHHRAAGSPANHRSVPAVPQRPSLTASAAHD